MATVMAVGFDHPRPRQVEDVREDKLFRSQFRALLSWCAQHDIPVHIPVESSRKARFYRAWVGDLAVIRQSCQTKRQWREAKGAVSCVVGAKGTTYPERIEAAREAAAERRKATGRKAIVCPAILNTFVSKGKGNEYKKNPNAKCGACVACALSHVDIVYPIH